MSYDDAIGLQNGAADPRLIDAMVAARRKSKPYAYRLWCFGGALGLHNFYLGKPVLGSLQACAIPLCLVLYRIADAIGMETTGAKAIGIVALTAFPFGLAISLLVDGFLIPTRVLAYSERLRAQLEAEADWRAA